MPQLHIKLGLIKQLVKALDKNFNVYYLQNFFPKIFEVEIKAGVLLAYRQERS